MSRCYQVRMEVVGLNLNQVRSVMTRWGWAEDYHEIRGPALDTPHVEWGGSGSLAGGESEYQAHEKIAKDFRGINPACRVQTRWLCLETYWDHANEFGSLKEDS